MGIWGEHQDSYDQVYNGDANQSSWTHELVAGGAAFGAFKVFEDQQRKSGKPVSHAFAKELLAGIAGAEVDKLAETKGADAWDREKAKRQARENAEAMYDEHYAQRGDQYDPNNPYHPVEYQDRFGRDDDRNRY